MTASAPRALWLSTVDWLVDDCWKTSKAFSDAFGFPQVRDDWLKRDPEHGYDAVFSRAGDSVTAAPSRFEFLEAHPEPGPDLCDLSPFAEVAELQAGRSQKIHATVLAVDDIDNAVNWVQENTVTAHVEPPCEHLPFPRLWIGWDEDGRYVPGVEPGIFLEMIPGAGVSPNVVEAVAHPVGRRGVSRVTWRLFLVDDLSESVDLMRSAAALETNAIVEDERLGVRRARFSFAHSGSASIDLAVPLGVGPAAEYLAANGAGVWLTGVAVADVEDSVAKAVEQGARLVGPALGGLETVLEHPDVPGALIMFESYAQRD